MNKIKNSKLKIQNYKKILIVRLDRIGDVVLSTPVLKAVRDAYPDSHIAFMVAPHAREIADGNPYINEVIVYDKAILHKGVFDGAKFVYGLARKRFDIAIMLHPTRRTHLLSFFSGIPKRLGYERKMGLILTDRIPDKKHLGLKHEIDYTLGLLRYIGIEPTNRKLYVPVDNDSEDRVRRILADGGISDGDKIVAINPGASCRSKRWPAERFAEVADALARELGVKIVVVSGSQDKSFADSTLSAMKTGALDLSGKTTIRELACLLKRSSLFISNDSGPVHIACAVGTPVISVFGRSDRGLSPRRWGPTNKIDRVIHKDVGCEICLAHKCKAELKCLAAITADEVVRNAKEMLSGVGELLSKK